MSLSGNLGFVSLDEVLRLLIRSGQQGSVSVRGGGVEGRVFVTRGGITLATTTTDEGLETLFQKSQLMDPQVIASGTVDSSDQEVVDLIREITVESIYRLNLHGDAFDVAEGVEARFGSAKPFELEQLLEESRKRLEDWAEVSQVVSDLDARLAFVRDLGDREEVEIKRDAWKVLSEVGAGASVAQVAAELGTTDFWAARVVARLVEDDLLDTAVQAAPVETESMTTETPSEATYEEPNQGDDYSYGYEQPVESQTPVHYEEPAQYEEPVATPQATDEPPFLGDATEVSDEMPTTVEEPSWEPEPVAVETTEETEAPESVDADQSWWQEPSDEADEQPSAEDDAEEDADVEEDTEAFLEKVFAELDPAEEEAEEGYGLLRRRRLGAMRDIARDS